MVPLKGATRNKFSFKKLCYYLAAYSVKDFAQKCSLVPAGEAIYKIICCEMER